MYKNKHVVNVVSSGTGGASGIGSQVSMTCFNNSVSTALFHLCVARCSCKGQGALMFGAWVQLRWSIGFKALEMVIKGPTPRVWCKYINATETTAHFIREINFLNGIGSATNTYNVWSNQFCFTAAQRIANEKRKRKDFELNAERKLSNQSFGPVPFKHFP